MSQANQFPVHIFLQRQSEWDDIGEPVESAHEGVVNAQIGDILKDPVIVADTPVGMEDLKGYWTVQHRQWDQYFSPAGVGLTLTLAIQQK